MARRHDPSDDEFREEVESHVALETDRLLAEGVSPEEAAMAARRKFGNVTRVRENFYESRRVMWFEDLRHDTRFAVRSLQRSPAFTAVALLTLAIGLGANTAIFSVVNAVLLRPLPYNAPDQLVLLEHPPLGGSPAWLRDAWHARSRTLTEFAGIEPSAPATLVAGIQPMPVNAAHATANFFALLGIKASLGRIFAETDTQPGAPAVAVLSHSFWIRQFDASADTIGKSITLTDVTLTGEPRVIIGVLPADFRFPVADPPGEAPIFARMQPDVIVLSRDDAFQQVIGRLAPGTTAAKASTELSGIFAQEASARFSARFVERTRVIAMPLQDRLVGNARYRLLLLMGAVGCVLLVVCANIASLLLARITGRGPEFAVRAALGARTGRLVRMILTENVLLAIFGGAVALFLAYWSNDVLRSLLAGRVSYVETVALDWRVLAFNLAVAAAMGVVCGLASLATIWSTRHAGSTTAAGRSITRRPRLGLTLVAGEVAVVFVLVLMAALLSQTLWNLRHTRRGFDASGLLTAGVMPGASGTIPELQNLTVTFFGTIVDRIAREPNVESVAAASTVPFSGPAMGMSGVSVVGRQAPDKTPPVSVAAVTPGYFATMRIRLIGGRDFNRGDVPSRDRVAIVNEAFLRVIASALTPGTEIQFGRSRLTVIGIVENTPDTSLRRPARPFVYLPMAQTIGSQFAFGRLMILVRARSGDPAALIPTLRNTVWSLGHDIVIDDVSTMDERVGAAVRTERDSALLFGVLGAIALVVAVAGVYGVVAYSVSQRTREIGIRTAIGATHRQVVAGIVRESVWPVAIGIGIGAATAVVVVRAIAGLLFEIRPTDPPTYVGTAVALTLTALAAAWIPARRAAGVDPVTALRAE
ncbi:MAG TPA: ABC transporter permease [Vicinamibacterales bacterium]|nr:ABC transporter permease [Vicinamibacterales bacterium]